MKRAQSAMEFLIIIGAMLFVFVSLLAVFQQNIAMKARENRDLEIKDLALTVKNEINLAAASTSGYSRTFTIPSTLSGIDYTITADEGTLYIITTDNRHSIALPIPEVAADSQPLVDSENTITKDDDGVHINP